MSFLKQRGFAIFWLVATADLALIATELEQYRVYTKPLLVPLLLMTFLMRVGMRRHKGIKWLLIFAMIFAFAGDVFLLNSGGNNFIFGLVAFLLMQVLYTTYFFRVQPLQLKRIALPFTTALIIGAASFVVSYLLWPYLGDLKLPLIIYCFFLSLMFVAAVNVYHFRITKKLALEAFIPGALLFVVSDFILAANMFYLKEAFLGLAVMATYCGAQYYLTRGFIKHLK